MATIPVGSNSSIILAKQAETEWGVIPGSEDVPQLVDYTTQRISSGSFTLSRGELEDDSITSSRGISSVRYGNFEASGSLSANLAYDNFDDLLESACQSTWVGNVLKSDGKTEKSFTFEVQRTDIEQYEVWSGFQVNSVSISSPTDGLTTISFELNGKTQESINSTAQDSDVTPQVETEAMHHCGGTINYKGAPVAVITSIELTLENGLESQYSWGECAARDITYGRSRVSGTISALYADATFQNDSLNEEDVTLDFTLVDPVGNSIKFELPKVKLGSVDAPIEAEGASTLSIPFRGQYDDTLGTTLQITRTPAP